MTETAAGQPRIVVGVDGSPGGVAALRWAARQAERTGATLDAVIAWQFPAFFGWAPVSSDEADLDKIAGETLASAVTEVFGPHWPAWVHTEVIAGHPAGALVRAAKGADMLVVGSRGHGGFTDALLGSVSTYCVHHADMPVTVIRPAPRAHHPGPG
ncbi:MAG TPA: universal stress protein [Streptosporangiaceae bacterium]|nr:universal stress protein [Streptosporangiaceae bacterium]